VHNDLHLLLRDWDLGVHMFEISVSQLTYHEMKTFKGKRIESPDPFQATPEEGAGCYPAL
jgi:hypothetical protein